MGKKGISGHEGQRGVTFFFGEGEEKEGAEVTSGDGFLKRGGMGERGRGKAGGSL